MIHLSDPLRRSVVNAIILATLVLFPFFLWSALTPSAENFEAVYNLPRVFLLLGGGVLAAVLMRFRIVGTNPFFLALAAYVALVCLTTALVPDPDGWTYTLLGSTSRSDGFLYQLALVLFAATTAARMREDRTFVRDVVGALLLTAALQSLLMLLQASRLDLIGPLYWGDFRISTPTGTIANTGMAAGLLLPFAVFVSFRFAQRLRQGRRVTATLYLGLALLYGVGIGATANRSSVIAFALALAVGSLLVRRWSLVGAGAAVLVCMSVVAPLLPSAYDPVETGEMSLRARMAIWRYSFEGLRNVPGQPLLGAGADGLRLVQLRDQLDLRGVMPFYAIRFDWDVEPGYPDEAELVTIEKREPPGGPLRGTNYLFVFRRAEGIYISNHAVILDRAHNLFLDKAISYGVLAALAWLALLLGLLLLGLWRGFPRSREPRGIEAIGWAAAVGALLLYSMGWFSVVPTELYHLLFVAAGWIVLWAPEADPARETVAPATPVAAPPGADPAGTP